jgi:hypothetical protein
MFSLQRSVASTAAALVLFSVFFTPSVSAAQTEDEAQLGRHILLVSGNLKGGAMKREYFKIDILGDGTELDDDPLDGPVFDVGGTVTYGFMPGPTSGFTVGGRIRGGGFLSEQIRGYLGSSVVMGSTIGPRVDRRYAYFLGGLGGEFLPSERLGAAAFSFQGGGSLRGVLVGAGVNLAVGQYIGFQVGLEVGYGGLW